MTTRAAGYDSDGDGMPDVWEVKYGLNPNSAADGKLDFDNDGYTNVQEYLDETGAFPAPAPIVFNGATNTRYAQITNWKTSDGITTGSNWEPTRFDEARDQQRHGSGRRRRPTRRHAQGWRSSRQHRHAQYHQWLARGGYRNGCRCRPYGNWRRQHDGRHAQCAHTQQGRRRQLVQPDRRHAPRGHGEFLVWQTTAGRSLRALAPAKPTSSVI